MKNFYDISHFDETKDKIEQEQFGTKTFYTCKHNGTKVIFKERYGSIVEELLNEVLLTNVGNMAEIPVAQNKLATVTFNKDSYKEGHCKYNGIVSEIFTKENEKLIELRNLIGETINVSLLYYKQKRTPNFHHFSQMKIQDFLELCLPRVTEKFKQDFIQFYIASYFFGQLDQRGGNNIGAIIPNSSTGFDEKAKVPPLWDNSHSILMIKKYWFGSYTEERRLLNKPIPKENLSYFFKNYPDAANEIFDKLISLKNNPQLVDACDFTNASELIDKNDKICRKLKYANRKKFNAASNEPSEKQKKYHLERISERALKNIKNRIDLTTKIV